MNLIQKATDSPAQAWSDADQRRAWLSGYFNQRALPLERQYIQLLYRQVALLSQYLHSPDLLPEQKNELSAWIGELLRTIHSNAFIEKGQRDLLYRQIVPNAGSPSPEAETRAETAAREAALSKSLWYLFGAENQREAEHNIHEFCRSRERQMAKITVALDEIASLQALVQRLQQRQKVEDRTARFLEEAKSYYQR